MSIKKYYEVSCDCCDCACLYQFNPIVSAREEGWIVTANGKHFDSKECYNKYKEENKDEK